MIDMDSASYRKTHHWEYGASVYQPAISGTTRWMEPFVTEAEVKAFIQGMRHYEKEMTDPQGGVSEQRLLKAATEARRELQSVAVELAVTAERLSMAMAENFELKRFKEQHKCVTTS